MKSDSEREGLLGPVRSVQTKTILCAAKDTGSGKDLMASHISVYDYEGRKVQDSWYQGEGLLSIKTVYEYNQEGQLLEAADYNVEELPVRRTVYNYDGSGRLVEWVRRQGSHILVRGVFSSVENGVRTEQITEGASAGKEVVSYDDMGNKTNLGVYSLEIAYLIESVYEDMGNPYKITFYDAGHVPLRELKFSYDSEWKLLEVADHCHDGLLKSNLDERPNDATRLQLYLRRSFTYNSNRQKLEEGIYNSHDSLLEKITFDYDSEGRLIGKTEYAANNFVNYRETYSRELDALGNWSRETTYKWDAETNKVQPAVIAERVIEYYQV